MQVQPLYAEARARKGDATPSFLAAREGTNERTVTRPGEMTREEYAAKAAAQPETMTFLSEPFERFKGGKAVFDCRVQCAFAYGNRKGDWKKLHEQKRWRDLAISVMQVGYLSDLSYFMLAESAKGLGLKGAAATYYQRAVEAGRRYGCGDSCEGFPVQQRATAATR